MAEVAAHLRQMSNDSMTMKTALRRTQEAKLFTLYFTNTDAVIIASDDIKAGRMGYKIAETSEEIERYCSLYEKRVAAYNESLINLQYHKKRLLNREKSKIVV